MEFRFELPDGYSYQDVLALMRVLIRKGKSAAGSGCCPGSF
ncbi:MAG: hypothetical protein ACLSHO_01270 [Dysosmobacter sp.]